MSASVAVDLRHGPARQPVRLGYGLAEARLGASFPYLGIVSRALASELPEGPDRSRAWARIGPVLEDVLNRLARGGRSGVGRAVQEAEAALASLDGAPSQQRDADRLLAERLVRAALDTGVLSYVESARVAARFLERLVHGEVEGWQRVLERHGIEETAEPERCELWSVREGTTSSVWRATFWTSRWRSPVTVALNVARDEEAGRELVELAAFHERLHRRDPSGIVPVLARGDCEASCGGRVLRVPVVAAAWLDGALELHVVAASNEDGPTARFFAVERFEEQPGAFGQRATGRLLSEPESDCLWSAHVARCNRMMELTETGAVVPDFEPNDGDLVLWQGRSIAVSSSLPPPEAPLEQAVLRLLLPSAHADDASAPERPDGRLHWNKPSVAVEVMARTWRECGRDPAVLDAALAGATASLEAGAEAGARALELARAALRERRVAA